MSLFPSTTSSAVLSPCRQYRYELTRIWGCGPLCGFIGLNPSTADETVDDPTIRREIAFAKSWGYGGIVKGNLYAWRSTDPKALKRVAHPVGRDADTAILNLFCRCEIVIAAWGNNHFGDRANHVCRLIASKGFSLKCLRTTKKGNPEHTLYLPGTLMPIQFGGAQ